MVAVENLKKIRQQLPIFSARDQIIEEIRNASKPIIIVGETGSGKTTQIPQYLVEAGITKKTIAVTQPRRVAAVSLAKRVSEEMGTKLGDKVGYSIRFDDKTSSKTAVKYMTDGMLLREILSDNELKRYDVIVLDEAHERSLRTDILFGMVKKIQSKRSDLRVIIMSATLDAQKFSDYFDGAKILYVAGRQYPVKLMYSVEPQSDYLDSALVTTFQIHLEQSAGDILVFLSGQDEIEALEKLMNEYARQCPPSAMKLLVCPLFAQMAVNQQTGVFSKTPPGCRKVILSTNVAETSITISGIKYVVDCGVHKLRGFHSRVGIESLTIQPISKASARQRMGRAGREMSGVCYRLYTEDTFKKELEENEAPEIQRCNMSSIILLLKASNIDDVLGFDYMDKPSRDTMLRSLEQLYTLGALDDSQKLTSLGRQMAEYPIDPTFAKVLIMSMTPAYACCKEVIAIIALLSVESVFYTPNDKRDEATEARRKFTSYDGDHLTLFNVLTAYNGLSKKTDSSKWFYDNFINQRSFKHVLDVQKQLLQFAERYAKDFAIDSSCGAEYERVLQCFLTGFSQNIAIKQADGSYKAVVGNQQVHIHPSSALITRKPEAIMFGELVLTSRRYMRNCSAVQPEWIRQIYKRN